MRLVLLSTDLMTMSVAQGAADRHGATLKVAPNSAAAMVACDGGDEGTLLAVDLRAGFDIAALMSDLRGTGGGRTVRVMAFGPHVHAESLAAAAAAGCDEVVSRGEFDRRLDAALGRMGASG